MINRKFTTCKLDKGVHKEAKREARLSDRTLQDFIEYAVAEEIRRVKSFI